ncbi:MAG: hypothetical protein CFH18_00338 [Alphaproteobacteria bacterium MarineAlpha5_Bin8]|nr:MAG: hypothetical protein CFH17_00702 [Alphaproteobacteria bacterium MarineAlpha5_Bin7]PPR47883.1 MAG: hypothetical protein CFH18_00338 [Alphaproteobacteria bacterium MarineAlpha5_Bin8]PPR52894.1 MAG: hypothetical protein CFH16_01299 [Alphaproteobacteria bacterium MarineAlpha5_Bin6]|tara:strand:- start:3016 stop:3627 length:612 start_codon:yes stop_codon:yes gene_type:complete
MNLDNIKEHNMPFQHWEISECLDENTLNEISYADIPTGDRAYDGTRAADHTGKGLDGKLRLYLTKENCNSYPYLKQLISKMQNKDLYLKLSKILNKDLNNAFVRLEIISDKKGFWLKPHKDISEKLMTMMIWANPYNESDILGTDLYNDNLKIVKTIKYEHNKGYFFASGKDTWHGLEKKEIIKERRCIQLNYVTFKTDWPVA